MGSGGERGCGRKGGWSQGVERGGAEGRKNSREDVELEEAEGVGGSKNWKVGVREGGWDEGRGGWIKKREWGEEEREGERKDWRVGKEKEKESGGNNLGRGCRNGWGKENINILIIYPSSIVPSYRLV